MERANKVRFVVYSVVAVIVIAVCAFTSISYAKFVKSLTSSSTAFVARPVAVFSGLSIGENAYTIALQDVSPTVNALSPHVYTFSVNNYLNTDITETALKYSITISYLGNLPLQITLTDDGSPAQTLATINPSQLQATTYTPINFNTGAQQSFNYFLIVAWTGNNDSSFAGRVDGLTITINWEQIE